MGEFIVRLAVTAVVGSAFTFLFIYRILTGRELRSKSHINFAPRVDPSFYSKSMLSFDEDLVEAEIHIVTACVEDYVSEPRNYQGLESSDLESPPEEELLELA